MVHKNISIFKITNLTMSQTLGQWRIIVYIVNRQVVSGWYLMGCGSHSRMGESNLKTHCNTINGHFGTNSGKRVNFNPGLYLAIIRLIIS